MPQLGRLKQVPPRHVWPNEERDFSTWLAENLELLSNEVGIPLVLLGKEVNVGPFKADLLAEDPDTNTKVIIENQLEKTDHDHLGKLITYAAGLEAKTIIWIAREIKEEHRKAIEWLNEHTDDDIAFFLVRIEVWQIADSPPAPKFQVVVEPNHWARAIKQSGDAIKLFSFWQGLSELARRRGLRTHKPSGRNYLDIHLNSTSHIVLRVRPKLRNIAVQLYIREGKNIFKCLEERRAEIEAEIGTPLEWRERPEVKSSIIEVSYPADFKNEDRWQEYRNWLLNTAMRFRDVFETRLKECESKPEGG